MGGERRARPGPWRILLAAGLGVALAGCPGGQAADDDTGDDDTGDDDTGDDDTGDDDTGDDDTGGDAEVCDGLDNDGDGQADEDFSCRQGHEETCTQFDSCQGTRTCREDCTWGDCGNPAWECDAPGHFSTCQAGACEGQQECLPGCSLGECQPDCPTGHECCDGGCVDVQVDVANCGACGRTCDDGECWHGGCCIESVRNGSEICDDQHFTVPDPYVPMYLVCKNDNGGVGYVSDGTGPPCEDGVNRCQGWEQNGMNAWDYLNYIETINCTAADLYVEVDLAAWTGQGMYVGSHDQPGGGGHMTETCIAEGVY
jgi:hypothetical protein